MRFLHLLICLACTLLGSMSFAQKRTFFKPDYDAIKAATLDTNSAYYYPRMLAKYTVNDTTLKADEYKYLYYGYFYNKPEVPHGNMEESYKEIREIMSKENPAKNEMERAVVLCKACTDQDPFDLRHLNYLYMLHKQLGDTVQARKYFVRVRGVVQTILSSGDGKTDETGYHVIAVPHEYFILNVLGYERTAQHLTPHPCDYMTLKSNEDNLTGIYFDVSQIFAGYNKMFEGVGGDFLKSLESDKKKKKTKR